MDSLSAVMLLLASWLTGCAFLYGKPSFRGYGAPLVLLLFWGSACMASLVQSWFGFVIWVELSSLALALLVAFQDRETARFYLFSQLAGGGFLLLGAALASSPGVLAPLGPVPPALFPLFMLGLGIKAAFPGLHFWLPRTHSRAPSEGSLLLSGYAVKMGIYGLLRLVETPSVFLMGAGSLMALYGMLQALMQHDTKRLLAFSTVSQLGFMVAALGTGTPEGRTAALFYLGAHALFKGLLFLTAGTLEKVQGTRDLRVLAFRSAGASPFLWGCFLLGAAAITGCPGTAGYAAKGLVKSAVHSFSWVYWSLQIAGVGTVLYMCRFGLYALRTPGKMSSRKPLKGSAKMAMLLLAVPLGCLGASPFFSPALLGYYVPETLLTALLPLVLGCGFFFLSLKFPRCFRDEVPDAEALLGPLGRGGKGVQKRLRCVHSGVLQLYLWIFISAVTGLFVLFSYP